MGDWHLRELDFETYLVGAVTDKIIDADRLARREVRNGFPGWALYRTFLCGDHLFRTQARDWCVAYAIAAAESGVVRKGQPTDMMGCLVGWDVYYRMHHLDWLIAGQDVADVAGVDPKTYRKLRNHVYAAVKYATDRYFIELQIAVRQVWKRDRHLNDASVPRTWKPQEKSDDASCEGFTDGDGNFWNKSPRQIP
jgi:hypothetical protein